MSYDPRGLSVERWTALTAPILLPYGPVPVSATLETWPAWAQAARSVTILQPRYVPDPRGYSNWMDWAFRLDSALRSLGL